MQAVSKSHLLYPSLQILHNFLNLFYSPSNFTPHILHSHFNFLQSTPPPFHFPPHPSQSLFHSLHTPGHPRSISMDPRHTSQSIHHSTHQGRHRINRGERSVQCVDPACHVTLLWYWGIFWVEKCALTGGFAFFFQLR